MGQPQESKSEDEKNEGAKAAKNSGVVRGLFGPVRNMLLGAGILVGGTGCGGEKPEAPKPLLDVRVTMVVPAEKACPLESGKGGEAKGEKKEEKKDDAEHWKEVKLSVIGDHVLSDGKYYLKTIEVEGKKRVAVWELIEGDSPSAMKPPSRVTARIDEKDGRLDFDGHIYFMARDPGAWGRGRAEEKTKKTEAAKKTAEPLPVPEKKTEEAVPYATYGTKMPGVAFEAYAVSNALAEMQADGTLKIIAGKEVRTWKLVRGSPPLRPVPVGFTAPATFFVVRTPGGIRLELPASGPFVRLNTRLQMPVATYWEEVR